jgi:hypothetical protein
MQMILASLILVQTTGITIAESLLTRLGVDSTILLTGLIACTVTGLIAHKNRLFIVLTLFLSIAINLPADFLKQVGIDPDILLATLLVMVLSPLVQHHLE